MTTKKIFIFVLIFLVLFVGFVENVRAESYEIYPTDQSLIIDNIHITDNLTDLGAESYIECKKTDQRLYEQIDQCLTVCENCAYQDSGCWQCTDSDKDNNEDSIGDSWFQRFKNWVKQIFINIGNFVKNVFNKEDPNRKEEDKLNKKAVVAKKVIEYHKAKDDENIKSPTNESVEAALFHAFKNAKDLAELLELRALMMIYCNDMANQDYEKEKKCNDRFMVLFREKGDEFKEKLIADIDPGKGDSENFKKIFELNTLLMSGKSSTGKGVWFSLDNIEKVRQQLKEKAKIWFKAALEKADLEKIKELHSLAMAYTSAQGEGTEIMEGFYPLGLVQDRVEILILKKLGSLDICNPDKEELAKIQKLLDVEKLITDDLVRMYIKEGDTESAYARLYEIVINKYPEKKSELPLPAVCEKMEEEMWEETEKTVDENASKTKECNIEIHQKELVGWDFIIHDCEESYNQGLACFNQCGWLPPVYLEESEHEIICYETMDGFIDNNFVVSCHPRPEPDFGTIQCVNDCLN